MQQDIICFPADLWGTWRQAQPPCPGFWSCWRRGTSRRMWTWRRPRCRGSTRAPCPRTGRRGRPGRWSETCPAPGAAPAETCSSPPCAGSDSPRLQPAMPEQDKNHGAIIIIKLCTECNDKKVGNKEEKSNLCFQMKICRDLMPN